MPIGGKLCLPHRRCAKQLDPAVVNFLVPAFRVLPVRSAVTIPRRISTVHRNGYSPSFEEIARGLSLKSLATVHKHITNLQKKGLLQRAHNRSRSIDVLPPRSKTRRSDRLPLLGRIAAGLPVEALETNETIALGDILGNREV